MSSGKIGKYEYLPVEEILPSDQRRVIKQAKFTYFPLGKLLENHHEIKQVESLKAFKTNRKSRNRINWKIFCKRYKN